MKIVIPSRHPVFSRHKVHGIHAPPVRPTPFGAAIVAAAVTTPFAVIVLLVSLLIG